MDDNVDKKYKAKHFPPSYFDAKKAAAPGTSHAVGASSQLPSSQSVNDLIAGFRDLRIQPKPAEIEGTPAPACPIAQLPHEILVHILEYVAILDVGDFVRLSQVCKRMAYIVATEEPIWKRVCVGSEVGFGGMHYIWQCGITGEPIEDEDDWIMDPFHKREGEALPPDPGPMCDTLLTPVYSSSWRKMFRQRPRIRFNGVYISTVNYIRPGQASPSQITWNTPVHVVTYYRYLRFFRDGTVISLLTTSEPAEVVHYLTKSHLETHQGEKGSHLPSAVMQTAARGRWRLSSVVDSPEADLKDVEGDLFVETEGVGKYVYRMELSLRSGGKGPKNNKLQWKGYWHYNKLTSDWGEFGLRNDKAFFWSRVRSYGAGE
jgi:F-box protein 9